MGAAQYLVCRFPLVGPSGERFVGGIALDITERKLAQETQSRLAAIVESSSDAIISRDLEGTILSWNMGAEKIFGWTASEAIGRNIRITTPEEDYRTMLPVVERVLRGEQVKSVDTVRVRKNGARFHAQVSFSAVKNQEGDVVSIAVILRDITERMQAEAAVRDHAEQMRRLSQRLSEVEEAERSNINRELHDRIGPNLVALKLNLHLAQSRLPPELRETIGAQIEDAQEVLETTVAQLRNVMSDLRPPALDDYGLFAALRTYAQPYAARMGIPVSVQGTDIEPRPSLVIETALFRIAQEALNNIAKHSQATHVTVEVNATSSHIHMRIADDGLGFEAGSIDPQRSSWGLRTMRERAQAIGAELDIQSSPGNGTRIAIQAVRGTA